MMHNKLETLLKSHSDLVYNNLYLGYKQLVIDSLFLDDIEDAVYNVEKALYYFNLLTRQINL